MITGAGSAAEEAERIGVKGAWAVDLEWSYGGQTVTVGGRATWPTSQAVQHHGIRQPTCESIQL